MKKFHYLAMRAAVGLLLSGWVWAQTADHPCRPDTVTSVPSRPTVATATDTTQCGTVELEYGFERQWVGGGIRHTDLSGGLRFGLLPNLDFHWSASDYIRLSDMTGAQNGYGDNWLGFRYRALGQGKRRPALGISYQVKVPTGEIALGGSGKVDHQFALLVSKDVHHFHFDFNAIPQLVGRPGASGFDSNVGFAWATSFPLTKRLNLIGEPYGFTALNSATPGFASAMLGLSFQAHRRLYLDTGFDAGVTHFAPHQRVFVGVTCAVGNVYTWLLPH